ncbi:CU044_5270 family protein [Streptomyces sp. NPDC006193]|uniref:CU044_5270 family protein n=1 Tax=Streptomyces sp. NPDC006193 TaxID=3155717 RepID=UPI0033A242DC
MPDELELLRRANPVPGDGPRFGDGPLDHRAERRLERLLSRPPAPRPASRARWPAAVRRLSAVASRVRFRPAPRPRPLWALTATGLVLATVLAALLGGPDTQPAVAAPRPLAVRAHSTAVPLDEMARLAAAAAAGGTPRLRKGTHVQSWSLGMSDGEPPVTLPQERVVRWRADGSRTEVVVATDPRRPGRPVVTDAGGEPRPVEDGHVLSRRTYPPSWSDAPPEAPPPHTAPALRAYLAETVRAGTLDTGELLLAVEELLGHWTLGARETAALVWVLADARGIRPAGQVTDRLGRPGQAYVYEAPGGARRMLILDPRTGTVLGLETTFTRDEPRYGVRAGDVMQYSAWLR